MTILIKWLGNFWNLVPAIVGLLQILLPMLKELVVIIVRIIGVLPFLWDAPEPIIEKVNKVYGKIYDFVEKIKNALLIGSVIKTVVAPEKDSE